MIRDFWLCVLLGLFLHPAAARAATLPQFLRANADRFPRIDAAIDADGLAVVHAIDAPARPLRFRGRHYHAFRFTVPEWMDGPLVWMNVFPQAPAPSKDDFRFSIVPERPVSRRVVPAVFEFPVRPFEILGPRFPHAEKFFIQGFGSDDISPGESCIFWYSYSRPEMPEIAVALTVDSARGVETLGKLPTTRASYDRPRPADPPVAPDPVAVRDAAVAEYHRAGRDAALATIDERTNAYLEAHGDFRTLFIDIWREAQVRTGRDDPEWSADLWLWLHAKATAIGDGGRAKEVLPNAAKALAAAGRYGQLGELLGVIGSSLWRAGYELDPSFYPDLGPAIPDLPEVRLREIPERPPLGQASGSRCGYPRLEQQFGRFTVTSFMALAEGEARAGRWIPALEWFAWAGEWAGRDHNGMDPDETANVWFSAANSKARVLAEVGLLEAADAQFEKIATQSMNDAYHNRSKNGARLHRIEIALDLGRMSPGRLAEVEELVKLTRTNRMVGHSTIQWAETIHARCLLAAGRDGEGFALLDRLVEEGSEAAMFARIQAMVSAGNLDGVEADLLKLLAAYRTTARKMGEAGLYPLYADFLEKAGRLPEALHMRREAVRLMRSFDLFARLPVEVAKLSALLARCGEAVAAKNTANEASDLARRRDRIPARVAADVARILAGAKPAPAASPSAAPEADLQPARGVIVPIEGRPVRGRLTLSNPSQRAVSGTLEVVGQPATLVADQNLVSVRATLGTSGGTARLDGLRVEAGSFLVIDLAARPDGVSAGDFTVRWTGAGRKNQESLWTLGTAESGVSSAVIDAGEFVGNAFYGVPIHHHIMAPIDATHASVRVIASQPARIEIYDGADRPIQVDAAGDGSLGEAGDELFQDFDRDGLPDIALDAGAAVIRMQVYPAGSLSTDGMKLSVELLQDGDWIPVAEDRLLPAQ